MTIGTIIILNLDKYKKMKECKMLYFCDYPEFISKLNLSNKDKYLAYRVGHSAEVNLILAGLGETEMEAVGDFILKESKINIEEDLPF